MGAPYFISHVKLQILAWWSSSYSMVQMLMQLIREVKHLYIAVFSKEDLHLQDYCFLGESDVNLYDGLSGSFNNLIVTFNSDNVI